MSTTATTPQEYITSLPNDRREAVAKLRDSINQNLDPQFAEQISYGMIGWVVPFELYPAGYHVDPKLPLPFVNLANQKNHIALYHMGLYGDPELLHWFEQEYAKTGYKLDIGKSCIRFKKTDQIPYNLIAELVKKVSLQEYVEQYQAAITKK